MSGLTSRFLMPRYATEYGAIQEGPSVKRVSVVGDVPPYTQAPGHDEPIVSHNAPLRRTAGFCFNPPPLPTGNKITGSPVGP